VVEVPGGNTSAKWFESLMPSLLITLAAGKPQARGVAVDGSLQWRGLRVVSCGCGFDTHPLAFTLGENDVQSEARAHTCA
jgi:hypothetical protein